MCGLWRGQPECHKKERVKGTVQERGKGIGYATLTDRHLLIMHLCVFRPGPPNFFMSQQLLHSPQSSDAQASHEQRGLFTPIMYM